MKKHLLSGIEAYTEDLSVQDLQNQATYDAMQVVLDGAEIGLERVSHMVQLMSQTDGLLCHNKQAFNINDSIRAACEKLNKKASQAIPLNLALAKLPLIYIDSYKIGQLLSHLLNNAYEATRTGGLISITSKALNGFIEVAVTDSGCGIRKSLQQDIFDPFYTTHHESEGRGLGLAISRDIALEHGGTLRVKSTLGAGSVFTLTLPISDIIIH